MHNFRYYNWIRSLGCEKSNCTNKKKIKTLIVTCERHTDINDHTL